MLTPISLAPSFGFGDRLGLATPGHIDAVRGTDWTPVFAQQSVRENARTGRTPQQVLDDAQRAVEAAGWDTPWGADADHLKAVEDLPPFVNAGYTLFTVDPGRYVDNAADIYPFSILQEKVRELEWDALKTRYLESASEQLWGRFDLELLMRAAVKYSRAVTHTIVLYQHLIKMKDSFDFEISIDETDAPTSALEHYFIANELTQAGVHFTSLAPRFIGSFEKGVDYIGDINTLDKELARHAAVTRYFGTYKISLHSGSDKFSVYPLLVKHWGNRIHIKTAGTSYLEALRTLATTEPALFEKIWALGLERYTEDRATYHVSADPNKVIYGSFPTTLLDDFHAREILHVTFGSALNQFGTEIKTALMRHMDAYTVNLQKHFSRHLDLLKQE